VVKFIPHRHIILSIFKFPLFTFFQFNSSSFTSFLGVSQFFPKIFRKGFFFIKLGKILFQFNFLPLYPLVFSKRYAILLSHPRSFLSTVFLASPPKNWSFLWWFTFIYLMTLIKIIIFFRFLQNLFQYEPRKLWPFWKRRRGFKI
jgi:hypothetical protein